MAVTLPKINIIFKELAQSFIARSERGIALLIVRDDTEGGNGYATYTDDAGLAKAPYTAENKAYIQDALSFGPARVGVAKVGTSNTLNDALALITANEKTGWITVADGSSDDWTALATWIKAQEAEAKSWKAVVYKGKTPDSMHVVNLVNETVTFRDERGEKAGSAYTPSLVGLLAACNVIRGATYHLCPNLAKTAVPDNPDTVVGAGQFVLINDDEDVRVAVDVNSLTTTNGETTTEDMKYIETVEALDLIRDDITRVFRTEYLGQYRNSLNNQMLFISAVDLYLSQLEKEEVLDPGNDNKAFIDVVSQRAMWVNNGKPEAATWNDATVRSNPYKRNVYLAGSIKIYGSMANLQWIVTLA